MQFDWKPIIDWLAVHGTRILIVLLLAWIIYRLAKRFIPRLITPAVIRGMAGKPEEEAQQRAHTLGQVLITTSLVLIMLSTFFTILSELQINIAPILAGAGIAGLAISFGAQGLVRDVIAGFFILVENQYAIGDVVKIFDVSGLVEDVNLRRTVLRDLDGTVHYIPNGEIKLASNLTKEWSRVNMNISVAYGEDLDRVIAVINRVGQELAQDPQWRGAVITPPQVLRVDNLGASGIDIKILGDTKPMQQWDIMSQLRLRLKKAFDKECIEIPWPHTKVYFGNTPPARIKDGQ
ncbi:MAG: mechanosensitive ion channel family protein [Chloroflexota bacterium]